ncbi:MAG TPA: hypothetical protein VFW77_03745 [Candidatus Saccharimonadales bacterium]|nr:hypothetical protein [Candidatus Saccharimonadales bacterium]
MSEVLVQSWDFGKIRHDNGFVPVPVTYPKASERIYELFTQRNNAMVEIMKGRRANIMAEEVGVETVSTFAADDAEAECMIEAVSDEFGCPESLREIFQPILKAYRESAVEGPVGTAEMPDLSEFDS